MFENTDMIKVEAPQSLQQMHLAHKQRRKRQKKAAQKATQILLKNIQCKTEPKPMAKKYKTGPMQDNHVIQWLHRQNKLNWLYPRKIQHDEKRLLHEQLIKLEAMEPPKITIKQIAEQVAQKHGVSVLDIISKRRNKKIVVARQEVAYRASKETTHSTTTIGRVLGDRDHTTIIHAIRHHAQTIGQPYNKQGPRKKWTDDETQMLLSLINQEEALSKIAAQTGRSINAVRTRIGRLGIKAA